MKRICFSVSLLVSVLLSVGLLAQEPLLSVDSDPAVTSPSASVLRLIRFNGSARGAQGQPLSGVAGVTFALYEEQEGGAPLWLETQNVSLDPQGRYTALLGVTSNDGLPLEVFSSGQARWLGIQVQGQAEQRVLLVSVPYALKAAEAETLSGKTAADFVLTEQLSTQVEEEINTQIEQQGLVTTEDSGNMALVDGSGTAGKLAKFTTATDIGNSIITEKNGNIGIGFNNPTQKLVVAAGFGGGLALNFTNLVNQDLQVSVSAIDATDKFAFFGPSVPTNLVLGVGGTEKMRVTNAGSVGIGTSTPQGRLHVFSDSGGVARISGPVNSANAATLQLFESQTANLGMQIKYIGDTNDRIEFQNEGGSTQVSIGRNSGDLHAAGDISADGVGVVKAAVFGSTCSSSGSAITRSFNNVNTSAITISNGSGLGDCTLNIPFDMSNRYVVGATGFGPGADRGLSVTINGNTVEVFRYTSSTGAGNSGPFFVLIY